MLLACLNLNFLKQRNSDSTLDCEVNRIYLARHIYPACNPLIPVLILQIAKWSYCIGRVAQRSAALLNKFHRNAMGCAPGLMNIDFTNVVVQLPLFNDLPEAARTALLSISRSCKVAQSRDVFDEGAEADGAYLLTKGLVKITRLSIDGDEQLIDIVGKGALVGEMALYDNGVRSATATTIVDSELLYIPKSSFFECADANPAIYRVLLSELSNRLRETNHSFARNQFLPVSGQVAAVLLHLAKCMGSVTSNNTVVIEYPIKHKDIASMIGAARENVSRTISQLNKKGVISTCNNSLTLQDLNHLQSMSSI